VVHVTRRYSRDHRPETNQTMLNLIVKNQAEIPIFIQAANGNQSDQTAFRSIVSSHVGELRNLSGIESLLGCIPRSLLRLCLVSRAFQRKICRNTP